MQLHAYNYEQQQYLIKLLFFFSGNFVLVGAVGSHLETLCKLALHVADIPIHHIDTKKQNTFMDGLRSALRMTGAEGKTLTLLFNVSKHQQTSLTFYPPNYIIGISTHLKLCLADAIHNFQVSENYSDFTKWRSSIFIFLLIGVKFYLPNV